MRKIKRLWHLFVPLWISVGIILALIIVNHYMGLFKDASFILPTLVAVNFTLFGFSLTSWSLLISIMERNPFIDKIMKKGYIKKLIYCIYTMIISASIALLFALLNLEPIWVISASTPSIVGAMYCSYFILFYSLNQKQVF